MVSTRSAKLKLDALEAAPLLHASEAAPKRSKGERIKQHRSKASTPQTEQRVLLGSSPKSSSKKQSSATKYSSSVARSSTRRPAPASKKQSDKHEFRLLVRVCVLRRSKRRSTSRTTNLRLKLSSTYRILSRQCHRLFALPLVLDL
jgi:hypothetical protein